MNNNLVIRAYNSNDKSAVLAILRLNTPEYFSPEEEVGFIHFLDHEIELYYITLLNDKIVGAGGINFNQQLKNGILSWGMIHPDYQRMSIGSALLNHRIEELKNKQEIDTITVRTSQLVFKFYEKHGFEVTEIVKDYWAKDFDLYNMIYKEDQ